MTSCQWSPAPTKKHGVEFRQNANKKKGNILFSFLKKIAKF
jgi:hypothetical protein